MSGMQKYFSLFVKVGYWLIAFSLFLFVLKLFSLELIYHHQQPLFRLDLGSLIHSLKEPGGFVKYLGLGITELYSNQLLGSLAILFVLFVLLNMSGVLSRFRDFNVSSIFMGSLILLLSMLCLSDYGFRIQYLLILALALCLGDGVKKFIEQSLFKLILVITILQILAFVLLGGMGLLLVTITIIVNLLRFHRSSYLFVLLAITILVNISLPFLGTFYYQIIPFHVLLWGGLVTLVSDSPVFVILVLIAIFSGLIVFKSESISWLHNKVTFYLASVLLLVAIFIVPKVMFDEEDKSKIEIDYLAYKQNWDAVLQFKDRSDLLTDQFVLFQINRAMAHSGQLLSEFFSIPQKFGFNALLLEQHVSHKTLIPTSDIYYDLGYINESRHWMHEAFTVFNYQPRIMKRLVEANIINGSYLTAEKYLYHLKLSPVSKSWAENQEKLLYKEELIAKDSVYKAKRGGLADADFLSNRHTPWVNLESLNEHSRINKMAFDYLVITYLTKHQLQRLVSVLQQFRHFGYEQLPKHVQEAVFLYIVQNNNNKLDMHGFQLEKANYDRFKEYTQLYLSYQQKGDKLALNRLHKEYADTYWYYIHFISPITAKK